MHDFQDFLTHKVAYVTIGEFQAGKFEEAKKLYEQAVSTYSQGFQGAYLLQEPGSDRGISIILWDHEEDMQANHSEAFNEILKQMLPLFATKPVSTFYELVSEIPPAS